MTLRSSGDTDMTIAELSIKRPVTTVMLFVSLFVIGLIAAVRLPLEAFPSVTPPLIFVQLPFTGSTPEEVERTLLRPVEEATSTMSGIKRTEGTARANGADLMIVFTDWSRNVAIAASEARERIDAIRDELPEELQRYFVLSRSTPATSRCCACGGQRHPKPHRGLRPDRSRVQAQDRADFRRRQGRGIRRAAERSRDRDRPGPLTAHGISLNDLTKSLQAVNFSVSAGVVDEGGQRLRVQPVANSRTSVS